MERFNLGDHARAVTTSSAPAQRLFTLGLNWCFCFNHEEGVKCFQKVLEFDPDCAMAHWGIAYAAGPFYNQPWCDYGEAEVIETTRFCHDHVQKAVALSGNCTAAEKMLIQALARRFPKPFPVAQAEFNQWDDAYADAMRGVLDAAPDDFDVMALTAEALMTRTPWKLWHVQTGEPAKGADTLEALAIIERALALAEARGIPQHPAILHLHIHVTEMSNTPEQALNSADLLADMCPDGGHMNHMPGHTYVLCGEYDKARIASVKAIAADDKYLDYAGPFNFYTTARCHDLHLMMYTCMFLGQFQPALKAANAICDTLSTEVLSMTSRPQMAVTMEGYFAMKMHVLVRFGRWQDIVAAPMPGDAKLYCVSTAMHHYAKVVGYAALKQFEQAEEQLALFYSALKNIPTNRKFFNNNALVTLGIGEKMALGELAYHKGEYDTAFAHLRESVARDDALEYTEPWAWMHPPRHALAALLAEQGHFEEAEDVYRTDLGLKDTLQRCARHPRNVWALHGLVECLRQRGESTELPELAKQLATAQALTDVPITAACLCRTTPCGD